MNNSNFWLLKINALLHDPPHKSFNIQGHEGIARALAQCLNLSLIKNDFTQADRIASASDRLNFPSYRSIGGVDFTNKPYLTHPLSGGEGLDLVVESFLSTQINYESLQQAIKQSLTSIKPEIKQDPQKLFLWLWRNWSSQIQQTEGNQLGALWDLLPADTRIPDHSIWAHQALTSAIAATNSNPAFLLFTISPVQAFISAARRTQDLWAGSYLLSYLNWAAIELIAEEIGPDAVIFPNLIEQPLCDRWLYKQGVLLQKPKLEDLVLPSLPNRFLAIVPYEQGEDLARKAADRMRSQWREITQQVRADIESLFSKPPAWNKTWERQTENLFETYWQVYPWIIKDKNLNRSNPLFFVSPHEPYLGHEKAEKIKKILEVYAKPSFKGGGENPLNIGAIYSSLYFITEKALGSRKGLRNFKQVDETGEKSTLSGERAAVYDGVDELQNNQAANFDHTTRKQIRAFWHNLAKKLQSRGRYEIQKEGKERLDAVELTKRCAWRSYFEKGLRDNSEQQEQLPFPSTYSVASASFKNDILTQLVKPESQSLRQSLEQWINSVYPIAEGNLGSKNVIPLLATKVNQSDQLLDKFLRLDGRLLYAETYHQDSTEFSESVERKKIDSALKKLQYFLKIAQEEYKISKPRKYFAVLMMDGDEMGKWLSGDKMPEYQDVLHPTIKDALNSLEQQDWKDILQNQRLMSPAIHGFISKALGDFSLKLVRHIVEKRYPGKLVYAGGDDVLALLPLDSVLEVARELRAAFSGEIFTGELGTDKECQEFEVKFNDQKAKSGYIWLEQTKGDKNSRQLLATMGHEATASTGIVISHYKNPLDVTLTEVRKAEKVAKNQEGRNAFSLTFMKRSGEIMSAGSKWTYIDKEKTIDTVKILLEFQDKFEKDNISSKFPYILRDISETLSLFDSESYTQKLYEAEIRRLLSRQKGTQKLDKSGEAKLAEDLAELVIKASQNRQLKTDDKNGYEGKLRTFADLLIFTRFLATGEGEED
jgi:CRISPR-associated protein Cmr2